MPQTPREIVRRCLTFQKPERMPRDLWLLPWAVDRFPEPVATLQTRFPCDFTNPPDVYQSSPRVRGDMYQEGTYIDEWGSIFYNIQSGAIGEVKTPAIDNLKLIDKYTPPYEILPEDWDDAQRVVNQYCSQTDLFVMGNACPRPWERLQFLRGTDNAMMDILHPEEGVADLIQLIHCFYKKELEFWATTNVDSLRFMDDWGGQSRLLISPRLWRKIFKPLYYEYCEIAHRHGKFIFMHSDGFIADIYDDLIEIGVDAINSQLSLMNLEDLSKRAKGKITFHGEIDRQFVLPASNPQVGREAVRKIAKYLYDPSGGIIAQFEFGLAANPAIAIAIFEEWEAVQMDWQ